MKRRYCKYSFEDTQRAIQHQQRQVGVRILPGTASSTGRSIRVYSEKHRRELWCVILARSSDWYRYNLNTYQHGMEAAIVGTHDSCISVPVLAMDSLEWYEPYKTRFEQSLPPAKDFRLPDNPDKFDRLRRGHYGHCVFVGALIVGRKEAIDRLMRLPERTRFGLEAEVKRLRHRRPGRPLKL
ncbi:hypothetical protein EI42_04813 [Thermosporothrix hazakensis]|jgi:hypothetical protein|uniref:Uncharacterized protein n=1 Tax=Thermosporothrix hazakensis TaxID=644383 RepID=A0A326U3Z4_THEHA|nr:hypothetical protein [Thermosporothrix hazakensis]PZW23890.1 hypothetical protein EI42_04813 [Thermosporothrix hazakensis]GCE48507.1 hypothetical protein KTH_33760 [Thermosporothrix hazakensis]